jgi:hypothetical protein
VNPLLILGGALVVGAAVLGVLLAGAALLSDPPLPEPSQPWLTDHERAIQHECGEILQELTREGRTILARDRARGTA